MMRLALPKGRNLKVALAAFRAAGLALRDVDGQERRLRRRLEEDDLEVLMLKDWDLPLYVEYGIADLGVVGSDVLEEMDGDLLLPARLKDGGCRMSLIANGSDPPAAGSQIRLATKYPNLARRVVAAKPWGAEIFKLSGSVELAPLLQLSEMALDIVQTGETLRENHLTEVEVVSRVQPCVVVNRASYQRHRRRINDLIRGLEEMEMVL
jgi:ATP phosphoribosyltransferase